MQKHTYVIIVLKLFRFDFHFMKIVVSNMFYDDVILYTDWFGFTQASAIFCFLGINIATLLICLALFSSRWQEYKRDFDFLASILCFSTG